MKKVNLIKIVSLISICALLMGAIVLAASATTEQQPLEISKKNILFGDRIQLMFALKASDEVQVTAACGDDDVAIEYVGIQTIYGEDYRVYQTVDGWAPQNINAVVTVTAVDGEQIDKLSYSVLMYLYERLNLDDLDPVEEADRISMYELLLAYATVADKVINNQDGRTPNELNRYHYVSVVGGTLDGYNTWGMFKEGDKPFANIDHALDLGEGESAIWSYSVNGEDMGEIEPEALKDLAVEGEVVITATNSQPKHNCAGAVCQPVTNADELKAAIENGGYYYLENDIELTSKLTVSDDVVLCLNGKVISNGADIKSALITVEDGASLTITDCSNVEHVGYVDPETKLWVEGEYAGEGTAEVVTLKGGIIMGGNGTFGGAIIIQDKTPEETPTSLTINNVNFVNNTVRQNDSQTAAQGGAIYANGASTTINNVTFVANSGSLGGAIYATKNTENMQINGCTFIGNSAITTGGAIYCGGEMEVEDSTFIGNVAGTRGGAIYCSGHISVSGSEFIGNKTEGDSADDGHGGAICTQSGGADISNSTFIGNTTYKNGGAIYVNTSSGNKVTTNNCTFVNNVATGNGGAVYVTGTGTYVDGTNVDGVISGGSTFGEYVENDQPVAAGNSANNGGAIGSYGTVTLYGTVFKNNTAKDAGGAVWANEKTVEAHNATFTSNSTTQGNGGAICVNAAAVTTKSCTFSANNPASGKYGGAVYVMAEGTYVDGAEGDATLGSTFSENSATSGGAILFEGTVTLYGSTFNNNTANAGGAIYANKGTMSAYNAKFISNVATGGKAGAVYVATKVNTVSCTFEGNKTLKDNGGAVYVTGAGSYTDGVLGDKTQGSTFDGNIAGSDANNVATKNGGAIGSFGVVTLHSTTFKNNSALSGGAMYVSQSEGNNFTVTVNDCTFENNSAITTSAMGGGAIAATGTITVNIVGGKFTGNSSGYYGGAISIGGTTATATNASISGGTIIENSIGQTGSALWFKTTGAVTVDTITVQNNKNGTNGVIYITAGTHTYNNVTATGNQANKGGVFYISGGTVKITNSELTGNTASGADGQGGAIYVSTNKTLTLENCTISGNEAKVGGGVYATKGYNADQATQITGNTDSADGTSTDNVYPAA